MNLDSGINLVSLTELKEYLKETSSDADQILQTLLNSASVMIQRNLGRVLRQAVHTEYYNGNGGRTLMLRNWPLSSVTSMHVDKNREWASVSEVDVDENIIIQKQSGVLRAWNLLGEFSQGDANVKVVYTAGFTIGEGDTEANLGMPHDIRLAVKRLVDLHYRRGYDQRKLDVQSESVGDRNTTFRGGKIPEDVLEILNSFRSYQPAPDFVYADAAVIADVDEPYVDFSPETGFPTAKAGRVFFNYTDGQFYGCKDGSTWSILG